MGARLGEGLHPHDSSVATQHGTSAKERVATAFREYQTIAIGNDGKVMQRGSPYAYPVFDFYFDVDDTLLQSSQVKEVRKAKYREGLPASGIRISDATADRIMRSTYTIAQETVGNGSYMTGNHTKLLAFITDQMAAVPEGKAREDAVNDTLTRLETEGIRDTDPFRINDGVLEFKPTYRSPSLPGLEEMFERTLLEAEEYRETVQAAVHLCKLRDQGAPIRVNLKTFGFPSEQDVKITGLMERNTDLRPDRIFETRIRKDIFMRRARENPEYQALPLTFPDGEGRTEADVKPYRHVVIAVDDHIESLNAQANLADFWAEKEGALALVRVRRTGTKDGWKDWHMIGDHYEINYRERHRDGVELAEELLERGQLYLSTPFDKIPPQRQGNSTVVTRSGHAA